MLLTLAWFNYIRYYSLPLRHSRDYTHSQSHSIIYRTKGQQDSHDITMPEFQNCVCVYLYFSLASHFSSQISDTQTVMITCEAARLPALPRLPASTLCYLGEPLRLPVGESVLHENIPTYRIKVFNIQSFRTWHDGSIIYC